MSSWVGLDDTPTSGSWSPTNTAGTDLVKTSENEYDGAGVGDSNLTKIDADPRRQRRQPREPVLLRLAEPPGRQQAGRRDHGEHQPQPADLLHRVRQPEPVHRQRAVRRRQRQRSPMATATACPTSRRPACSAPAVPDRSTTRAASTRPRCSASIRATARCPRTA